MWFPRFLTRHRGFVGNVAAMMSGKSIAAAIALFTMPVVARLFTPSDFGVAASFLAIIGIVSNVACLRYEVALVLPKEDSEAIALMALAYRILLAVCVFMLLMLGLYRLLDLHWPILELLGHWMWLLPLGVLLMASLQIQEQWLARKTAFKLVAVSMVLGTVVNSGIRISLGKMSGSSVVGLISSNLLGLLCRLVLQRSASTAIARAIFRHFDLGAMRQIGRQYQDFPKLNAPANLIFSLGQDLPVLLFGVMFSPAVAGFYAMANRLSQAPIVIVARSMRRVFLQKAAAIDNSGRSLHKPFLLATVALALLGVVPFGFLWLFGQPVLQWLLGERWFSAGRYLEIMAPWLLMLWVTAPSNPVFIVLRKQNVWLVLQVWLTILRLGAFVIAYWVSVGPEWTLQAFVVATVAGNLFTIGVALVLISKHSEVLQTRGSSDPPTGTVA